MRRLNMEEISEIQDLYGCSLNCALIVFEFIELDSTLSTEERLTLVWNRSKRYADYEEGRAQNILVEFLNKYPLVGSGTSFMSNSH